MNSNQDPRFLIHTNLDEVQNEIEKAAKDRKDQINDQKKDDTKALKDEMKDLKSEVKDSYKELKQELKDSDDPNSKEKIEIAKQTRKIIENNIEADYNESIENVERHAEERINSIDEMLDDSKNDPRAQDDVQPDAYHDNIMHTDIVNEEALRTTAPMATTDVVITDDAIISSDSIRSNEIKDNEIKKSEMKESRMNDSDIRDTEIIATGFVVETATPVSLSKKDASHQDIKRENNIRIEDTKDKKDNNDMCGSDFI